VIFSGRIHQPEPPAIHYRTEAAFKRDAFPQETQ